jgi:D-arabinose 1-dehydrogenase-like Zn-dependent alcohol dehydrogenase
MRQIAITEWGKPLEVLERETPRPTGEEVLVEVEVCGVCHSDVHVWDGYFDLGHGRQMNFGARLPLPFSPGHEIVAKVRALGPEAGGVALGQSYVVYPWIGCGTCAACRAGEELLCGASRLIGVRRDGGFADHLIIPHSRYLVPYDGLPRELACTFACSGVTAYSALKKVAGIGSEEWLAVIGTGGVGLNAIQMAGTVVGARVVAADIDAAKREQALASGAHAAIDNDADDAVAGTLSETSGGAAAAIDFVGSPETMKFGIDCLRRGGKLVVVGLFGGAIDLPTITFPSRLLTVQGSFVGTLDEMKEVVALAQAGKIAPIPISTRPASEANAALEDLRQGGRVMGRTVLVHGQ